MANITVTEGAAFIPELWGNRALGKLPAYLNLAQTVDKDFSFDSANAGDTLHIPKRGTIVANAKVANTDVTAQTPSATTVDVSLNEHWEVTFLVEDIVKAQANQNIMDGYMADAMATLAEKVEAKLAGLYTAVGDTVDASAAIEKSELLTLRKKFVDAKFPRLGKKYLYLSSEAVNDILAITDFVEVAKYGPNTAIMDGELGRILGFSVFESQLVATSGSPTTYQNLAYGEGSIILATRTLPVVSGNNGVEQAIVGDPTTGLSFRISKSWNADKLAHQITMDMLFGVAAQRPEHLMTITTT